MHSHIYGKKHFKHKTNFKDLVVFSDVTQNKIKTELPSEVLYFEVEKGYKSPNKWFIHLNSTLSGEYGDFYIEDNPVSIGEIKGLEYDPENDLNAALKGFLIGGALPYYKINGKLYVKIEDASLLNEAFVGKLPENKEKNIEYDAFTTVFISEDGAKLLQAYEAVKQVNAHEVVVFIERNSGSNLFGTVFRIKKGKNVKTLLETNRIRIAEIARAYGVGVLSNELSKMIAEELLNKKSESSFYFVLAKGGAVVRWGSDVALGIFSGLAKEASKGIDSLKLGDNYWKTEIDGKENKEYKPLLPKLKINESFSSEEVANKIYKEFIVPVEKPVVLFAEKLNTHWLFKKIIPFKSSQITGLFQNIPKIIKEFLDKLKENAQNTYDFINGLLVGLLNSIIDFFKSIFDILAILLDVINGVIQAGKFFEKPGHYLRLLAEGFENVFDLITNIFTLENLKSWIDFLVYMPVATVKLLAGVFAKGSNAKISIDPGAMGYYIGFLVGFIASEVVVFFATGGTGTIAKGVKVVLQSYKELAKVAAKTVVKTVKLTVEAFLTVIRKLKEFAKNLPKHLDALKGWVDELIAKIAKATRTFSDDIYILFEKLNILLKKVPQQPVLTSGVPIKTGDDIYALVRNGKEIFRGTKKEIDELAKKIDELSSVNAKKHLDESIFNKSQADLLDNWDNLKIKGKGRRNGQRLKKSDIKFLKKKLEELNVELELHPLNSSKPIKGFFTGKGLSYKMPKGAAAIFITDGVKMKIVLRKKATIYEFFHEFMHFRHSKELGLKKYLSLGGRGTLGELTKETYVFDKLISHAKFLTKEEIEHALWYINERVRYRFGENPIKVDFNLDEIPSIKEKININEIFKIK